MKISKLVKCAIVTAIFAILFVSEALGCMEMKDRSLRNFESELGSRLRTTIHAEYYDKDSSYGEPSIVYCEEGGDELKIVLAEDSPNRLNKELHNARVLQNDIGEETINLIHRSNAIAYIFAGITFVVFVLFLVKVSG